MGECGAHSLRNVGYGAGVEGIGCGQLPGGFGTVPYLTGVDDDDRQGGGGQRSDHGPLGTPRGFEHHARGCTAWSRTTRAAIPGASLPTPSVHR